MKNSLDNGSMVAVGAVALILGFLGYREVSGERKMIKNKMKGENDKTSVELGKTKTELSDPVLISGQDNIRQSFKTIIINMVIENRKSYRNIFSFGDFYRELVNKTQLGFFFNQEVLEYLDQLGNEEKLMNELGKMRILNIVELLINENRLRQLYKEEELAISKKSRVIRRPIRIRNENGTGFKNYSILTEKKKSKCENNEYVEKVD